MSVVDVYFFTKWSVMELPFWWKCVHRLIKAFPEPRGLFQENGTMDVVENVADLLAIINL